jgi:CBS domain-containing protein
MSSPLPTIDKNSSVETAAKMMLNKGVRHLAVEDNNLNTIGIITTTYLAEY